jgi:RNA-directed DNA polymerase
VRIAEPLERAVTASGFAINAKKVRLQTRHQRQSVTGLHVNAKANVSRKRIRRLRAMLHAWEKFGLLPAAYEHFIKHRGMLKAPRDPGRAYRNVVYGQLSFIKMVRGADDPVFLNLAARLIKLDPNPSRFIRQMAFGSDDFDIFISHASEDKDVARPIFEACAKLGMKAFLDEAHIGWGQSFTQKINTALGSARTVLAIVSQVSVTKEWPVIEVNTALSLEVSGQKKVVPLIVGKPDLSRLPLIHGKDAMAWNGDAAAVARRLKAAIEGAAPRRPTGPTTAVPVTQPPPVPLAQAAASALQRSNNKSRPGEGPWRPPTKRKGGFLGLFGPRKRP